MGTIAVLLSAPDERTLSCLNNVDDLVHLAVPSHQWEWATPLLDLGFTPHPFDTDRLRQPFGYDEMDFEFSANFAQRVLGELCQHLPAPYDLVVSNFRISFGRWFTLILSRRVRVMMALQRLCAAHPNARVILFGQEGTISDYAAGIKLCGMEVPFPAVAYDEAGKAPLAADWQSQFAQQVASISRGLKPIPFKSQRTAMLADLRNRQDFRFRNLTIDIMGKLSRERKITHLQPATILSRALMRTYGEILWLGKGRITTRAIDSLSSVRIKQAGDWVRPLADVICQGHDKADPLFPSLHFALQDWLGQDLPGWIAIANNFDNAFAQTKPAALISNPGHMPLGLIACDAARLHDVPSFDIQSLLNPVSARLAEPAASYIAMLDDQQAHVYKTRFAARNLQIETFGPPFLPNLALMIQQHRTTTAPRKRIVFPTQPIWRETEQALKIVLKAVEDLPDFELIVSTHPAEKTFEINRYEQAISNSLCANRVTVTSNGSSEELIASATAVVTVCSNVAYRAALAGMPTIAVIVDQPDALRFDVMGIAMGARSAGTLKEQLLDIANQGTLFKAWDISRQEFVRRHGWDLQVDATDHICRWIEATIKKHENQPVGGD